MLLNNFLAQSLLAVGAVTASALPVPDAEAVDSAISKRQSTTWAWQCTGTSITPGDWKAFNVGGCNAQLTFTRGRNMVGVEWGFDAVYADGSRQRVYPYTDVYNLAISDTFYTVDTGVNFISTSAQSRAFTSVHEFSNVCKNGAFPTSFFIYTAKASSCQPKGYSFTSPRITPQTGTRPAGTTYTARRINNEGQYQINWSAVSGAAAYAVLFKTPTGEDEVGNPYFGTFGARVNAPATSVVLNGINGRRWEGRNRQVAINVVNSQGVWSDTRQTRTVQAPW